MRPNDSVRSLAGAKSADVRRQTTRKEPCTLLQGALDLARTGRNHLPKQPSKSPLGVLIGYTLLLGLYFCVKVGVAQTRLDSSQVAPLQGQVLGKFVGNRLRDFNSAADHGNGTTNGIASAITDCGITTSCSILVPPSYGSSEPLPGYQLNTTAPTAAATTPGNISIFDRRYGDARMSVNRYGFAVGYIHTPAGWLYNYYNKAAKNAQLYPFALRQLSLDGGANQQASALSYADKTNWDTMLLNNISHTPGQHVTTTINGQTTSLGDSMLVRNQVTCYGGYTTQGDIGCRAFDNLTAQGNVEYSGTLVGSPTTSASSVTVSPTQGTATQGSERYLVRLNAGTISSGTISQLSSNYLGTTVTGSGTSWPVSTAIGTLGTNVTAPGTAVVTPTGFSVGSMSQIQASSLICVADAGAFEMVRPSSVTATTFTATFDMVHPSNAVVAVGGLCGYLLDLTADDVTNSSYSVKTQTITGTLHFAFPVVSTTAATTLQLWVQADGFYQQPTTRWNATTANGYVLYPYADVLSAQQFGGISNTLTLGPNNVAWTAGDTVSEFLYPSYHATFGNNYAESYYPNIAAGNGFSLTYNMPLQGNEAMASIANNGPANLYSANGGHFYAPFAIHVSGPTSKSVMFDRPPDSAAVAVGCINSCSSLALYIAAANAGFYDFVTYDQANKHWNLSANTYNAHYSLAANAFNLPFSNTYLALDGASKGYVATQQLRSGSSANTDISGEMMFSNATSLTQTLQGKYASHPECLARPQFDAGSTNRHWISYSGSTSTFTVNFASAVSGTVTYSCLARN